MYCIFALVAVQCVDTAVFMGLVQQAVQPQQLQLHDAADEQLSSRQSSASDVSASPTHVDVAPEPAAASTALPL